MAFEKSQLRYARLVEDGRQSPVYFRRAVDHGSVDGQIEYAECPFEGFGVEMDIAEAERYLEAPSKSDENDRRGFKMRLRSLVVGLVDPVFKDCRIESPTSLIR
jgi:TPR repeat protein